MHARTDSSTLQLALVAAFHTRRDQVLQHLLDNHGPAAIAQALSGLSAAECAGVLALLPPQAQTQIRQLWPSPQAVRRAAASAPSQRVTTSGRGWMCWVRGCYVRWGRTQA
ncbi:MAG: hypothetical protein JOY84_03930 [Curvibacter sp.]|nr:hypothetical protein [Curvibacter sp.]